MCRSRTSNGPHTYISSPTSVADSTTSEDLHRPSPFHRYRLKLLLDDVSVFGSTIKGLAKGSRFYGWRMGVLGGCVMSFMVLCCNVAIIAVGAASESGFNADGISNIIIGDEVIISRWNTALHVLINALSTTLLAGSNYTMQVLNSPTRKDVDVAHAKGQWLDIGILSPHNLRKLPWKRTALWYTLALSSIPLHLL